MFPGDRQSPDSVESYSSHVNRPSRPLTPLPAPYEHRHVIETSHSTMPHLVEPAQLLGDGERSGSDSLESILLRPVASTSGEEQQRPHRPSPRSVEPYSAFARFDPREEWEAQTENFRPIGMTSRRNRRRYLPYTPSAKFVHRPTFKNASSQTAPEFDLLEYCQRACCFCRRSASRNMHEIPVNFQNEEEQELLIPRHRDEPPKQESSEEDEISAVIKKFESFLF